MPVWRFWNTITGSHFYTGSEVERDVVATNLNSMNYEGVAFTNPTATDTTVWRFRRADTGTFFYTASTAERDAVLSTMPNYVYEGAAYSASTVQTASASQATTKAVVPTLSIRLNGPPVQGANPQPRMAPTSPSRGSVSTPSSKQRAASTAWR